MTDTIAPEQTKRIFDELIHFAETVVLFSPDFDTFIRDMFSEDTTLIETLPTHEFTAGRLEKTHHRLKYAVCGLESIIEAYRNSTLDELVGKACLAQAAGILALRCHDAE